MLIPFNVTNYFLFVFQVSYGEFEDHLTIDYEDCYDHFLDISGLYSTDNAANHFVSNTNESPSGDGIFFKDEPNFRSTKYKEEEMLNPGSHQQLQRIFEELNDSDQEDQSQLELTMSNTVSLTEFGIAIMEPAASYISMSAVSFSDDQLEDLSRIASSVQFGDTIESYPATVDEILHAVEANNKALEDLNSSNPIERKRKSSKKLDRKQTESAGGNKRKRKMSEYSVTSVGSGSYGALGSPQRNKGFKKRLYQQDPSEDPALEKSRKNALIAKRNREKKKKLVNAMESRCNALSTRNELLNADKNNLSRRIQSLEEEVFYLKSVLANQNALSAILSTLTNSGLKISSSFKANGTPIASSSSNEPFKP